MRSISVEKMHKRDYIYIIVILVFIFFMCKCSSESIHYKDLYKSTNSELKTSRNKLGQEIAEKESVIIRSKKDLKFLNDSLYKEIKRLRGLKSVIQYRTKTEYSFTQKVDTVRLSSEGCPVSFKGFYSDEWFDSWYSFKNDSIKITSLVRNEFVFTQQQKRGILKQKPSIVSVSNKNPYAKTTGLDHYSFTSKQKLISIGIQAGVGLTPKGIQPYVGGGFQVNIR